MIKYKTSKSNVVADVLSKRYTFIPTLDYNFFDFELLKECYTNDPDFEEIFKSLPWQSHEHYYILQGYLFFKDKLYMLNCLIRNLLTREAYGG